MIALRLLRHGLLSAAIFSGPASAAGLGEITLHSRIGEALRADIPILAGSESLDATCFSLGAIPDADFPVITTARMRLVRIGQDYRLIISGSKAIDEPVAVISLRAGCGMDLQREYVLLPAPPQSLPSSDVEPPRAPATPAPRAMLRTRTPVMRDSETSAPDSDSSAPPTDKPRKARAASPKRKAPLPPDTLSGITSSQDRIILGAAPPPAADNPMAPFEALDERLLKLETTLRLLNQEVDKLDTAATLSAESRAMQQKLQEMQAQQRNPGLLPSAQAATAQTPARSEFSRDGWIQLLFGLLLGGSVSAGVAHLVSQKQDKARSLDAPPPRIAKPGRRRAGRH